MHHGNHMISGALESYGTLGPQRKFPSVYQESHSKQVSESALTDSGAGTEKWGSRPSLGFSRDWLNQNI